MFNYIDNCGAMKGEEVRRIQLTGRSTYIVSLPKKWVAEMGLKTGSQVVILREGESLVLVPRGLAESRMGSQEALLKISDGDTPDKLARAIIAIYLNGYNSIRIVTSSDQITPLQRNAISELVRKKIVGTEIIFDSPREMVLKVLVSYPELSVESALRRMYLVASSMFEGAVKALINSDKELAKNIIELDDEVDRFGFYIVRQLKAAVQNSKILKDIGLSSARDCLGYRIIVKFVERIADHAARIAENVLSIDERLEESVLEGVSKISSFAKLMFEKSIESLFRGDYILAEEVVSKARSIASLEVELMKTLLEKTGKTISPNIRIILENIRRVGEYSSDIAEVVLNLNVDKMLAQ